MNFILIMFLLSQFYLPEANDSTDFVKFQRFENSGRILETNNYNMKMKYIDELTKNAFMEYEEYSNSDGGYKKVHS